MSRHQFKPMADIIRVNGVKHFEAIYNKIEQDHGQVKVWRAPTFTDIKPGEVVKATHQPIFEGKEYRVILIGTPLGCVALYELKMDADDGVRITFSCDDSLSCLVGDLLRPLSHQDIERLISLEDPTKKNIGHYLVMYADAYKQ